VSPKSKRGVMTKSLQQIQKENRKFILEATGEYKDELELLKQQAHQIYHEIISKSFNSIPLTHKPNLPPLKSGKDTLYLPSFSFLIIAGYFIYLFFVFK